MARPPSYKPEYAEQAAQLCRLGATDAELATFFKVSTRTIYRWQAQYPEFCQALKAGKETADDRVERSLFHKAVGYTFESEKLFQNGGKVIRAKTVEHVPPDTTAAIFWLKNRRPEEWRDRRDLNVRNLDDLTEAELVERIRDLDRRIEAVAGGEGEDGASAATPTRH